MSFPKHNLTGSERAPMRGAREIGPANPNEKVEVTIRLRSRAGKKPAVSLDTFRQPPNERTIFSREEYEKSHGADPSSIALVEGFAREHGLAVVETSPERRTVILSGTVAKMNNAFGVQLKEYEHPTAGRYRGRTGAIQIPENLTDHIEGVFGLDNRPQASPHFRRRRHARPAATSFTPPEVASLYEFPTGVDGSGECIGIVELGGGFKPTDLTKYFNQIKLTKSPNVTAVSIGNGKNQPTGDPNGPDGEVMLDIEVAGSIAPGANIVVYFAENTDAGFLNAITTAVHDKTNKPSVISISWGSAESDWTSQAMTSMDEAFQAAAAMGVSVCVACGDNGSTDGIDDGLNHVDFPASSPYALACGGTLLQGSGNTISNEIVWNELKNKEGATGGGVSDFFPLPSYQQNAGVPPSANPGGRIGRGVPDVCGDADPNSGYQTYVDGQPDVIGGTSAVAPLWAGLIALLNEKLSQPVGFLNPLLYQKAVSSDGFRDITSGNNGAYSAGVGWDACSGLGSPIGTSIAAALGPSARAKTA
ncbi:MAG: S8/S53 family peptidase [Acidobacteriaceae bacterium]|nr:S8/S53 family peptidase [Acidobacteriaceae bacterium]